MGNNRELLEEALEKLNASDKKHHRLVERDIAIITSLLKSNKRVEHIPPSKMYLIDDAFARSPVGRCDQASIGITACKRCEDKMCYWKGKCIDQLDENGNPLYPGDRAYVYSELIKRGKAKYDPREVDRVAGDSAFALIQMEADKLNKGGGNG